MSSNRWSLSAVAFPVLLLVSGACGAAESRFEFHILPKAFQSAPTLDTTVNTEMTPAGRLQRVPTPDSPITYLSLAAGFKPRGEAIGGEHPPAPEQLQKAMKDSLANAGYVEATAPNDKPTLAIVFYWGSHNRIDPEQAQLFPELARQYELERARLIGGVSFLKRVANIYQFGEWLSDRTPDIEFLRYQAADDLYYVVASAYDFAELAQNKRQLLWRTTMTVNANGVSMRESLPTLIATATPYFGRETEEPHIGSPKIHRWGVKVGEDKIIEYGVPLPKK
jgi:hypothetical protein